MMACNCLLHATAGLDSSECKMIETGISMGDGLRKYASLQLRHRIPSRFLSRIERSRNWPLPGPPHPTIFKMARLKVNGVLVYHLGVGLNFGRIDYHVAPPINSGSMASRPREGTQ